MNFLALQFLLYILCLSFTSSRSSRIKTCICKYCREKKWTVTHNCTTSMWWRAGRGRELHFFPLVSLFRHQSCRRKQKSLVSLVCLQKQAPINSCWRKKKVWGSKKRERRGCAPVGGTAGNQCWWFQSCAGVWGRRWSQKGLGSLWGHPLKAERQFELVSSAEFPWVCRARSLGLPLLWVPALLSALRGKHCRFGVISEGVGTQALGYSLTFCFNIVQSPQSLLKSSRLKVWVLKN